MALILVVETYFTYLGDAYMKMNGRYCCSEMEWLDDVAHAKLICAQNKSCIGIELRDDQYAGICMDAICTSRALGNERNGTSIFHRKIERYGK